ncbi:MAG: glycosyltransferase family 1 protein [Clostridiales bacterium]|jgi:glycosyltransferase involved in cell wall biosynthesis|nr:glycosyltransferase family 1 protein [Clostridiales bacterium]
MDKINILYSTVNRSHHIIRYGEFFKWELQKLPDVNLYLVEEEANINDLINKFNVLPDFIFFDDFTKNVPMHGLDQVSIPKGVLYWDIHTTQNEFQTFVWKNKIDMIFSFYRDAFRGFFPEFARKLRWLPNHVYTEEFKDYGLEKEIDFLLMGALSQRIYPLRTKIAEEMAGMKGFVHHYHPGYRDFSPEEEIDQLVGESFARAINRAKIFFTDDSVFRYPIAKYFEVPACNTLLLASGSKELIDLGFINRVTFVEINQENYLAKAMYYLEHEKERKEIALRGYEMVRKRHSTAIRARQFADYVKKYLYE